MPALAESMHWITWRPRMSFTCVVDVARAAELDEADFQALPAEAQAYLLSRLGARTGYRMEWHAPGEMPGCLLRKPVPSLDEAKAQAEARSVPAGERFHWGEPTDGERAVARDVLCVLRAGEDGARAAAGGPWELWYKALFDLDCPAALEATGEGLVAGLTELWSRDLQEGVHGLSRFTLRHGGRWHQIEAVGADREAMYALRRWVFRAKGREDPVDRAAAERALLRALSAAHARLVLGGGTLEPLMRLALTAPDASDLLLGLSALP